ncbi:MAG: response regulator [Planctomycetota bacterium]
MQRLEESQELIDAVLLDLSMPGMSGREVLRTVKRRWPTVPVVLCSGYLSDELPTLDGPDAVVPKPYSMKKLVTTMSDVTTSESDQSPIRPR